LEFVRKNKKINIKEDPTIKKEKGKRIGNPSH
jgi:hypothetical protein